MLTPEQLREFGERGYLVVTGAIAEEYLAATDVEIDALTHASPPDPGAVGNYFLAPDPEDAPAGHAALFASGAIEIANELVAPHHLDYQHRTVQIACRLPGWSHIPGGPHIDNHAPTDDAPGSFSVLAGIFLCDESKPASGNLWVWPGSHLDHERLFNERGPTALLESWGHSTLLNPPLRLTNPVEPVLAERGDLLLAHYLLGHNSGGNETDRVRRMLYYRLGCDGHRTRWADTFLDVLTEFAPVRAAVTSATR